MSPPFMQLVISRDSFRAHAFAFSARNCKYYYSDVKYNGHPNKYSTNEDKVLEVLEQFFIIQRSGELGAHGAILLSSLRSLSTNSTPPNTHPKST